MPSSHDPYARLLLDRMLSGYGSIWQEYPLAPSPTRRVDVVFVPGPRQPEAMPLGAMAHIAATPCLIEAFSGSVSLAAYERVLGKTLEVRRQARRRRATPQQRTLRRAMLWVLCPRHPRKLLDTSGARPMAGAPRGFYLLGAAHPVGVVSLRQLPDNDDTLLLRLLAKQLARGALKTLRERASADPRLAPLLDTMVEYVRSLDPDARRSPDMLDVATEMKKWEQALLRQGRRKGRKEGELRGELKGVQKGLQPLLRQFARRLGRDLTEPERAEVLARFDTVGADRLGDVVLDLSPAELAAWLGDPQAR